ncbi:MAG: hypothetical protein RL409_1120 [Gemmatimonadota bacterium]
MLRCLVPLLAIGCAMMGSPRPLHAQTATPPTTVSPVAAAPHADSVAAMTPFARAHAALNTLRERADAQYADPKNKTPEVLAELRAKYHTERAVVLKAQGLTEASYGELTRRISSDDAARLAFEAALAKVTAK